MSEGSPPDWDRLDAPPAPEPLPDPPPRRRGSPLLLASWADLALLLGGAALALAAVRLSGYPTALAGVPWALAAAASWWLAAASVLLAVRRGTPGMLLVGVRFAREIAAGRLGRTVALALLSAVLLGAVSLLGGGRPLLTRVAGSPLAEEG